MKNSNNTLLGFLILILMNLGCEDNLELQPQQSLSPEAVITDAANLQNLLIGLYDEAANGSAETPTFEENIYGGVLTLAIELLGNSGELSFNGTFEEPAEFNEKAILTGNVNTRDIWLNAYEVNNQANIILENLDVVDDLATRNRMEGEAKFLRALVYFDLARVFGLPYEAGQQNAQPAVPIVLGTVTDASHVEFPSRNSVEEVYVQVIADLTDAYDLLPDDNDVFADKYTAQALLALVYLQQGNFAGARDSAHDVIQNSGHMLAPDFASAFNNDGDSAEDVFAWQITAQDGKNDMNTFWSGSEFGGRPGNPDVSINPVHFEIYDDTSDERNFFFYENSGGLATAKWQGEFSNIPFIRLAEMHLIRAESNFREGTAVGMTPENEMNTLRERSGAQSLSGITLQDILDERIRELSFEGFRLHDIKRLEGMVGTLNYDNPKLIMPVPQRETDANPNLEQNPTY
ncbi:MAG: RagB/SusD family nutrient uptake outer membrane protein [Pricia sp.]|nr:RagB/SusD family nutrient uptake outer membrane protein [Pricia sp.]